jgi:hypothetical protein
MTTRATFTAVLFTLLSALQPALAAPDSAAGPAQPAIASPAATPWAGLDIDRVCVPQLEQSMTRAA